MKTLNRKLSAIAKALKRAPHANILAVLLVSVLIGSIGSYFTFFSRAAVPYAYVEVEDAELSGEVVKGNDSTASGGQYVEFGATETGSSPPADWEEAVASNNINTVMAWYDKNTGYESCYDENLGRNLTRSDLTPMSGQIDTTHDGQVFNRVDLSGRIRIFHDNVVVRCSRIHWTASSLYAIQATSVQIGGGVSKAPGENWLVDRVTLDGTRSDGTPSGHALFASSPGIARHVYVPGGFGSGLRSEGSRNQLWEYNYVRRIVTSPDSHNTAFTLRSNTGSSPVRNITVRRNLLTDGTSSALSFYPRSSGVHENTIFEENIFDIQFAYAHYCAYRGNGTHVNNIWRGNIYGQSLSPKCGASGHSTHSGVTQWTNNRYIDGTPIP